MRSARKMDVRSVLFPNIASRKYDTYVVITTKKSSWFHPLTK